MTVSAAYLPPTYTGNDATTEFSTVFPFYDASEILVTEILIADETETVKTITTHYTVSGGDGAVGTVTAVTAPASTVQWRIERVSPRTQAADFAETGEFHVEDLELTLDKMEHQIQEVDELAQAAWLLADAAASEEYVDDAVEAASAALQASADAAASSAAAAAVDAAAAAASAADAAADLDAILGGSFADAPVSVAMQPVVASATLAGARTAMGVPGVGDNLTWTGNNAWNTGTAAFNNGLTVTGTLAAAAITGSSTLVMTGATTLNGATTINNTLAVTGTATLVAATCSGLITANAGIAVVGSALNTAVEVDVASASTIDLDAAASNKVRVTGTTTITAVTLTNGRFRMVRFAGALTLTHGASLILPNNGSNITTAAGDTALIAGEAAGVVRVLHFQPASGTSGGKVAQVVRATWATQTDFTDATPLDNTIPQITEGAERFTASITPVNSGSTLLIDVELQSGIVTDSANHTGSLHTIIAHLHRDSTANAIGVGMMRWTDYGVLNDVWGMQGAIRIMASTPANATSASTFRVRSGKAGGTNAVYSHNGTASVFNGTYVSSITITEILP